MRRVFAATLLSVAASASASASAAAGAEIYRWTDAQGRVHYGDRVPEDAGRLERIDAPQRQTGQADPELEQHRERSRRLLEVWDAERRERAAAAAEAASRAAEREQSCALLREELENARHSSYLVRRNAQGEREILAADERIRYESQLADTIAAHCQ